MGFAVCHHNGAYYALCRSRENAEKALAEGSVLYQKMYIEEMSNFIMDIEMAQVYIVSGIVALIRGGAFEGNLEKEIKRQGQKVCKLLKIKVPKELVIRKKAKPDET